MKLNDALKTVGRTGVRSARSVLHRFDLDVVRRGPSSASDVPAETVQIWERVSDYTMTSFERVCALVNAVDYVVVNEIEGDFVECGVWRGGSAMAIALRLQQLDATDRRIQLFDTFTGMTAPGEHDVSAAGVHASETFEALATGTQSSNWAYASEDDVRRNMTSTGYPMSNVRLVAGMVEDTIPELAADAIALLRLDTDWYESTRHELVHLYPRLAHDGVLIIDDYGHWAGSRRAVDEYVTEHGLRLHLARIDASGRIAVKQSEV
ncbi:MAG: TylF/MycF/NovP-related O-methyltransferase [Ilumatobacter sp.]|uniref:TylF/MycF/NovP-related O-methyltransferase n=1 Tax=Ilumatobacter sp. TaxID=1967498 RepID=UPI0026291A5F|nr:TylF/MycF/NovP-related O-methyltransferase [Ilumatobacter sp.]MDJ0771453.1 TylF/MycF/NovP-related O-methyltransferase [Ilumatobacter sp.]